MEVALVKTVLKWTVASRYSWMLEVERDLAICFNTTSVLVLSEELSSTSFSRQFVQTKRPYYLGEL